MSSMVNMPPVVSFGAVVIVRVSLLLVLAAFVVALMRRSSAAARHLVWTCALAGSLAVPLLSMWGPAWDLPILPAIQSAAMASNSRDLAENVAPATVPVSVGVDPVPVASVTSAARPRSGGAARAAWQIAPLPLLLWAAGMFLVVARLAFGTFRMTWVARRATRGSGRWLRVAERLADALGVARRVVFLQGGPSAMPMTWGVVTSRVLMPRAAEAWPADRQRVVLLHELAHVKRRDCLTQLVAQLVCALYWFNPLAWFAAKRLRAEREHACDDLVLASGTRGSEYADHLIEIARSMRSTIAPTWAAVAMAHRSQLEGRLMAILDPHIPRRFPSRKRAAGLVAFMTVFVVPIALITPAPRAAETASPAQFIESPVTPAVQPAPAPTSQSRARSDQAAREATKRSVREALRPTVESTAAAIGSAVVQAVKEGVVGGIKGGIAGGIQGGIKAGIPQEVEREIEQETQEKAARRDPRVVAALVEALKDTDKDVRESAMQALANLRAPEALDAIRASLKDTNPSVREQAAFALGQYRDGGSVDALAGLLGDSSADVREQAVFALGQIRDPRSAAPLMQALKDSDGSVREQAAFALGQLRSKEAVEPLTVALQDRSADVREQAAFALGQIRDRRAVDSLVTALKDQSADVREQAAFALGQLRDPRATDGLTAALKDSNVDVRRQAAFALGQIR